MLAQRVEKRDTWIDRKAAGLAIDCEGKQLEAGGRRLPLRGVRLDGTDAPEAAAPRNDRRLRLAGIGILVSFEVRTRNRANPGAWFRSGGPVR